MAPVTDAELEAVEKAAERGATKGLERHTSRELPAVADAEEKTPEPKKRSSSKDGSRLSWPTAMVVSAISMALGIGIAWGANSGATSANEKAIADVKKDAGELEKRVREVEQASAANTKEHDALGEKVQDVKDSVAGVEKKVEALKDAQAEINRKLDRVLDKLK